jgi:hypothetical protein
MAGNDMVQLDRMPAEIKMVKKELEKAVYDRMVRRLKGKIRTMFPASMATELVTSCKEFMFDERIAVTSSLIHSVKNFELTMRSNWCIRTEELRGTLEDLRRFLRILKVGQLGQEDFYRFPVKIVDKLRDFERIIR